MERRSHAFLISCTRAKFHHNILDPHVLHVWLRLVDQDEEGCLSPELLARPLHTIERLHRRGHPGAPILWLEFEVHDGAGWGFLLDGCRDSWESFALRLGVAPGQPFLLRLSATYTCSNSLEGDDYDSEFEWELVAREPLDDGEALRRWDEWLAGEPTTQGARDG